MHEKSAQTVPDTEARKRRLMEKVIHEYESPLLGYAMRLVGGDLSNAQDVVQNVFIKLYRKWPPHMKPGPRLKSWLFRAVHNEAVDLIRKDQRLSRLHESEAAEPTRQRVAGDARSTLDEKERRELVMQLLKELRFPEKQVVLLRLQQEMSYKDIAAVTGRTVGNIGNILHHAVKKLAASMRNLEGGVA